MVNRALIAILILAIAVGGLIFFLRPSQERIKNQELKIKVAATIFPLADIARQIGGDRVDIVTVMPPGANMHTFEPTPQTVQACADSVALLKIGEHLDDWADTVKNANPDVTVLDMSRGIALLQFQGANDPHYWLTFENGSIIARNVADALTSIDPAHAQEYQTRLAAYDEQLLAKDKEWKNKFASVPHKDFATFHEAWFYFAGHYGLHVAAAFEPSPGKEPTPQFVADFMQAVRDKKIRVIFTEPQLSSDVIAQTAKDLGVKLELVDPVGGSSPATDSYIKMMEYNCEQIYRGLQTP